MPPLFPATLALYAVACTLYLVHVVLQRGPATTAGPADKSTRVDNLARLARLTLALAFGAHAVDIGWLCTHGLHPVVNAREALSFASWLMVGAYLVVSLKNHLPVVGALIVPTTLVLDVAARLVPGPEAAGHVSVGALGAAHITLATCGVALFAVAAGAAIVYMVSERSLKRHKASALGRGGPALMTLDQISRRCITVGFPVFTLAMVTGAVWVSRLPGYGVFHPRFAFAALAWGVYAWLLVGRVTVGWRGRRAAVLTLVGFGGTMATLLVYFFRGLGTGGGA